ncbi:MAG: hypothetical protein A2289_02115 [Deltaproteobacteria bacterium RIFOXYA12_FULL_58_15]|nr:MAG: hypothetical protein A2289_02115 [Deltaproteobacteria bacterium RIFOXYA12_FULL_58_15]OGR14944.1 MAG: hypothetical protein A2341_16290 [Deltaproteobacteria bacterium RIFOXYB12_FULL_58_9]
MTTDTTSPGALTLYHELVLEGRAPSVERFCAHFPEEPKLRERIIALDRLRADLGAMVGRPPAADVEPPEVIGGFKPLRLLAAGGMGRVFLAEQESPRRLCALKLLESGSPVTFERFRREADLAARLNHRGIATVFAFGVEEGIAYLAAELVHGFTLRELLSAADRVTVNKPGEWLLNALRQVAEGAPRRAQPSSHSPVTTTIALAVQMAEALGHAHERGVVHRDVKPSNVMVTLDGFTKLIDFGIAVPVDDANDRMTRTGVFIGSHSYAAPEQLRGEHSEVGPWTDTYALAATLFEMLAQRTPFEAVTLVDRLACANQPVPVGPQAFNPEVPRQLDALVRRALDPDPHKRFHDGNEMAEALRHCPTHRSWVPSPSPHVVRRFVPQTVSQWVAALATVAALFTGILYVDSVQERESIQREYDSARVSAAIDVLAAELHGRELAFWGCLEAVELVPIHPKADRGFKVALTVSAGRVLAARVVSAPVGIGRRTESCLLQVFSELALPGVGLGRPLVLEAEVELPIAGSDKPSMPKRRH